MQDKINEISKRFDEEFVQTDKIPMFMRGENIPESIKFFLHQEIDRAVNEVLQEILAELIFYAASIDYDEYAAMNGCPTPDEIADKAIDDFIKDIKDKVERIKLDMDVVTCDCGEPYKDSDPAILVNELLSLLTKEI